MPKKGNGLRLRGQNMVIFIYLLKILFIYLVEITSSQRGRQEEAGSPLSREPDVGLDPGP